MGHGHEKGVLPQTPAVTVDLVSQPSLETCELAEAAQIDVRALPVSRVYLWDVLIRSLRQVIVSIRSRPADRALSFLLSALCLGVLGVSFFFF